MAVTFKDRGCVTHVVARTMRWQLNAEAACMSRAITGLVWEKRFGRSLLKGRPAHRRCSNRAGAIGASTRSRRTPTLACLFPRDVDGRPGPIPLRCPILASTQSGLQTRGWCASGRGSLVVVGSAAPDRSPVLGEDSTEIEKASEGMGHLPRLTNQARTAGN